MSYARWGEACEGGRSDVYVFAMDTGATEDGEGHEAYVCMSCRLERDQDNSFTSPSPEGMHIHLGVHRQAGHTVPQRAFDRLSEEIAERANPKPPQPKPEEPR